MLFRLQATAIKMKIFIICFFLVFMSFLILSLHFGSKEMYVENIIVRSS